MQYFIATFDASGARVPNHLQPVDSRKLAIKIVLDFTKNIGPQLRAAGIDSMAISRTEYDTVFSIPAGTRVSC